MSEPPLTRTITDAAHSIITERITKDLRSCRREAAQNREHAEEALGNLEKALTLLDTQRTEHMLYGAAAAGVAALLGGLTGAAMMRRRAAVTLAGLSRELASAQGEGEDVHTVAEELAKSEWGNCPPHSD